MISPHIWWYIARASGIIAWALMTVSVLWGTLLSTRVLRKFDNPSWLQDLHRYLGGMSIIMLLAHMVSLMLDGFLHMSLRAVLVPFATDYRALPVALGIVAFYLLIAVQGSSLLMRWLPRRFWKAVHYSSYLVVILVSFHAGFAGTDVGALWYRAVAFTLIGTSAIAVMLRVIWGTRVAGTPRAEVVVASAAPASYGEPAEVVPGLGTLSLGMTPRTMVVASTHWVSDEVLGIRLVALGGGTLPSWHPGAHITLTLPIGLQRQYSLCGDPADRLHFDIAVLRTVESTGGSWWIHDNLRPGMTIEVSGPLNHFELEPAFSYLFIAGGIGITPIKAMIESLPERREWRLVYIGRSRDAMAFCAELLSRYGDRVWIQASDENDGKLDLGALIDMTSGEVYCCGPEGLMATVAEVTPPSRFHFERFEPIVRLGISAAEPLHITCRKSRKEISVAADQSILEALELNGVPIMGSCRKGVCGTCEVRVTEGSPEHLDSVIDDAEKDRLGIMYPCVSRARGSLLVLDV